MGTPVPWAISHACHPQPRHSRTWEIRGHGPGQPSRAAAACRALLWPLRASLLAPSRGRQEGLLPRVPVLPLWSQRPWASPSPKPGVWLGDSQFCPPQIQLGALHLLCQEKYHMAWQLLPTPTSRMVARDSSDKSQPQAHGAARSGTLGSRPGPSSQGPHNDTATQGHQ